MVRSGRAAIGLADGTACQKWTVVVSLHGFGLLTRACREVLGSRLLASTRSGPVAFDALCLAASTVLCVLAFAVALDLGFPASVEG